MDSKILGLYKKNRKVGLSTSLVRHMDRNVQTLDPITKEIVKEKNIDLNPIIPDPSFGFDRILLFTALLITSHPRIATSVQVIREKLHITELWEYKKYFDHETDTLINVSLKNMSGTMQKATRDALEVFFNKEGKNLSKQDWANELATYIFTGILPLAIYYSEPFELVKNTSGLNISNSQPIIIIKKRIEKHELNQLIEFIRDNERELIQTTQHLPSEPVKRIDADLTKLAIGLWVYKNDSMKSDEIMKQFLQKEEVEENYLGKYFELTKNELPNFKSDALVYLNQLYPL